MKHQNINLTEAEWKVMQCLWDRAPQTGREIVEQMKAEWSRSTTLTLLRRLEDKQAVCSTNEGSVRAYLPLISKENVAVRETESLLNRAFQGSISMLVSALTKKQKLSKKEIDELYSILDHMDKTE